MEGEVLDPERRPWLPADSALAEVHGSSGPARKPKGCRLKILRRLILLSYLLERGCFRLPKEVNYIGILLVKDLFRVLG